MYKVLSLRESYECFVKDLQGLYSICDDMENIHRLVYHCSKVEGESRYVMEIFLSIPIITYFIRGRDPTSRYLEGLQRPELVCLSLVRKVHLDLLEELFLIDHENLESLMTFVTQERKIYHQPEFGVPIIDND